MSRRNQKEGIVENIVGEVTENSEQAVDSTENFAKEEIKNDEEKESLEKEVESDEKRPEEKAIVQQKSGGRGLALLALLIAFSVGGIGHFMASKKFTDVESQIQALSSKVSQQGSSQTSIEIPNFDSEKAQLSELVTNYQKALARIDQLETSQLGYMQKMSELQRQLQKLNTSSGSYNSAWLLSEADFLLNTALRKVVLDNDLDTAKNLLIEVDQALAQLPSAANVREAIKSDLNTLANINTVDQNALMQRAANLTTKLDDLPILENKQEQNTNAQVTDSIDDWQANLEKSAISFLDHFIRISDRNVADEKAFVAPNQEIYLRENIRLRLQIAILAIPRQQNELYKKSLQTVSSWIRSYFETSNENVKSFLKEIDELAEQTIYIDAPNSLQSLKVLEQQINKVPQPIEKVEIKAEQGLERVGSVKEQSESLKEETNAEQNPASSSSESSSQ